MTGLEVSNLAKKFGDKVVLDDVTLTAAEGEFVTMLGPSGCGKTTTLRCIAGLESPDAGRISLGGRAFYGDGRARPLPPERRRIGMVFQSYAVWPHLTVEQNVAFPLKMQKVGPAQRRAAVEETLELVGLGGLGPRRISTLSGGQQQRVGLARALVARPDLLLFDEPLSNLDSRLREQLRDEIGRLQRAYGTTAVYVTHDQTEAMALSDRIYVMGAGLVAQAGIPAEIYGKPRNRFVANFVGFDNFAGGTVSASGPEGRLHVRLDATGETVSGIGEGSVGRPAEVAFRSSVGRLLPRTAGAEPSTSRNVVSGVVEDVRDFGDVLEWRITRPSGAGSLRVRLPTAHHETDEERGLRPGDDVWVTVHPQDTRVLPVETDPGASAEPAVQDSSAGLAVQPA